MRTVDHTAIDRALSKRHFRHYIEQIAPSYDLTKFHLALADILTRFANGEFPNLIIQAPPQCGKSEQLSRLFPGYLFAKHGGIDVMATSYGDDLVRYNSVSARRYIESDAYKRLFPDIITDKAKEKRTSTQNRFDVGDGSYLAKAIRAGLTGNGASFILIDDPVKNRAEADSETIRNAIWAEYTSSVVTRWRRSVKVGGRTVKGGICLTMTRWHEDDLAGRLLALAAADPEADQWVVFNFPAICEAA